LNAELSLIQNIYANEISNEVIEDIPVFNDDITQIPSSSTCIQQPIAETHQNNPVLLDTSIVALKILPFIQLHSTKILDNHLPQFLLMTRL